MQEINVLMMCISSFIAVFTVLSVLSIIMRALIAIFPYKEDKKEEKDDFATIAAIDSTYAVSYPGWNVTHIKEVKRR